MNTEALLIFKVMRSRIFQLGQLWIL